MRNNIAKRAAAIGWPILVTTLILLGWEISVRALGIRSIILPPPSAVFAAMAERHDLLLTHLSRFISPCSDLFFPSSAAFSSPY